MSDTRFFAPVDLDMLSLENNHLILAALDEADAFDAVAQESNATHTKNQRPDQQVTIPQILISGSNNNNNNPTSHNSTTLTPILAATPAEHITITPNLPIKSRHPTPTSSPQLSTAPQQLTRPPQTLNVPQKFQESSQPEATTYTRSHSHDSSRSHSVPRSNMSNNAGGTAKPMTMIQQQAYHSNLHNEIQQFQRFPPPGHGGPRINHFAPDPNEIIIIPGVGVVDINNAPAGQHLLYSTIYFPSLPRAPGQQPFFTQVKIPVDQTIQQLACSAKRQFHQDLVYLCRNTPGHFDPKLALHIQSNINKRLLKQHNQHHSATVQPCNNVNISATSHNNTQQTRVQSTFDFQPTPQPLHINHSSNMNNYIPPAHVMDKENGFSYSRPQEYQPLLNPTLQQQNFVPQDATQLFLTQNRSVLYKQPMPALSPPSPSNQCSQKTGSILSQQQSYQFSNPHHHVKVAFGPAHGSSSQLSTLTTDYPQSLSIIAPLTPTNPTTGLRQHNQNKLNTGDEMMIPQSYYPQNEKHTLINSHLSTNDDDFFSQPTNLKYDRNITGANKSHKFTRTNSHNQRTINHKPTTTTTNSTPTVSASDILELSEGSPDPSPPVSNIDKLPTSSHDVNAPSLSTLSRNQISVENSHSDHDTDDHSNNLNPPIIPTPTNSAGQNEHSSTRRPFHSANYDDERNSYENKNIPYVSNYDIINNTANHTVIPRRPPSVQPMPSVCAMPYGTPSIEGDTIESSQSSTYPAVMFPQPTPPPLQSASHGAIDVEKRRSDDKALSCQFPFQTQHLLSPIPAFFVEDIFGDEDDPQSQYQLVVYNEELQQIDPNFPPYLNFTRLTHITQECFALQRIEPGGGSLDGDVGRYGRTRHPRILPGQDSNKPLSLLPGLPASTGSSLSDDIGGEVDMLGLPVRDRYGSNPRYNTNLNNNIKPGVTVADFSSSISSSSLGPVSPGGRRHVNFNNTATVTGFPSSVSCNAVISSDIPESSDDGLSKPTGDLFLSSHNIVQANQGRNKYGRHQFVPPPAYLKDNSISSQNSANNNDTTRQNTQKPEYEYEPSVSSTRDSDSLRPSKNSSIRNKRGENGKKTLISRLFSCFNQSHELIESDFNSTHPSYTINPPQRHSHHHHNSLDIEISTVESPPPLLNQTTGVLIVSTAHDDHTNVTNPRIAAQQPSRSPFPSPLDSTSECSQSGSYQSYSSSNSDISL